MKPYGSQHRNVERVVVTRHPALLQLLIERKLVDKKTRVLTHVSNPDEIRGKHVFGVIPIYFAALAHCYTTIFLAMEPKDRGQELSIERLREIAGKTVSYSVKQLDFILRCAYN